MADREPQPELTRAGLMQDGQVRIIAVVNEQLARIRVSENPRHAFKEYTEGLTLSILNAHGPEQCEQLITLLNDEGHRRVATAMNRTLKTYPRVH